MNSEMIAIKDGSNMNSFLGGWLPQALIGCSLQADEEIVHRQSEQGFGEVFVQDDEGGNWLDSGTNSLPAALCSCSRGALRVGWDKPVSVTRFGMTHRNNQRIKLIILLFSLLLSACTPAPAAVTPQSTPEVHTPAPELPNMPAAGKLPGGSPLAELMSLLSGAGLAVTFNGPAESSLLDSQAAHLLTSNGAELFVYEYASAEAAAAAAGRISPDGTTLTGADGSVSSVRWIAPPHFWQSGVFIVQYLGEDAALLTGLDAALGAPFAGASLADEPEAASALWKEIRQAGTGIGFAVPCGWEVGEMPAEGGIRSQTMRSYDEAFFAAHSEKGDWKGGVWPKGAYKLDLTLVESVDPGLSTFEAYSRLVDASLESLSGGEEVQLGANTWTEVMVKSALHPEQPATKVYVYRLAPERLLIAAAYPLGTAIDSPDVQAILASMVMSSEQAVILPQAAPQHQLNSAACAP